MVDFAEAFGGGLLGPILGAALDMTFGAETLNPLFKTGLQPDLMFTFANSLAIASISSSENPVSLGIVLSFPLPLTVFTAGSTFFGSGSGGATVMREGLSEGDCEGSPKVD